MDTDVKASYRTTTGQFLLEDGATNISRTRVRGALLTGTGTLVLTDGGAGGTSRITFNNTGTTYVLLPSDGVLFQTNVFGTISGLTAATIFYG